MRILRAIAACGVLVAVPLLLTAASSAPPPDQHTTPARCYSGSIYESISGYPTAEDLIRANVDGARARYDDLIARAPEISSDPYYLLGKEQAQGAIEGFTALLEVAHETPRPDLDSTLRAVDHDGQLIAEVTFSNAIDTVDGAYALDTATLPSPGADPARGCSWRSSSS